ncbi:MAG: hypothetical protein U0X92_13630 [Anaerolineales bacterium]
MTRAFAVMPTFASAAAGRRKRHTSTHFERMRRSHASSFLPAAREAVDDESLHGVERVGIRPDKDSGWYPQIRREADAHPIQAEL